MRVRIVATVLALGLTLRFAPAVARPNPPAEGNAARVGLDEEGDEIHPTVNTPLEVLRAVEAPDLATFENGRTGRGRARATSVIRTRR